MRSKYTCTKYLPYSSEWCQNLASVHWCRIKSQRQCSGWSGKGQPCYFARQRGSQWAIDLKTMCLNLGKRVRSFIVIVQRGCDQLVDIPLMGWWWGKWESASSTFWFQPVWGLHACGQHAVNFFHLVGMLASAKQLKDVTQDNISSPWGGTKSAWPCFMVKLLLFCLSALLCFYIFSILWLNLLFETWGRLRRIKFSFSCKNKKQRTQKDFCKLWGPCRVLLCFKSRFYSGTTRVKGTSG